MIAQLLAGERVRLRPVGEDDREPLARVFSEPEVARRWGDPVRAVEEATTPAESEAHFVIEVDGECAGFIQWTEEDDPMYRHAGIDIALGARWQGRGLGPEAIRVLARHLFGARGHHRLTIDPAADNRHAISAYRRVGFRPVGIMRQYERGPDGEWHDGLLMDLLAEELVDSSGAGPGERVAGKEV
jgi:aminoglycoside 6'-N-acetyltransferase